MSRLYDALRRAEAERERIRNGGAVAVPPLPLARPAPRGSRIRLPAPPHFPTFTRGLLIFASGAVLALLAVQIAPRLRPTPRPAAQLPFAASPAILKLDYRLDLTRTGGAAR